MHGMTRSFKGNGATELANLLVSKKKDVEKLMGTIPGLISYNVILTSDGCTTFTLCKEKSGTDKSLAVAKEWLKANAGHLGLNPPIISEGKVVVHIGSEVAAT
jgi:hypothetical protein